jgi:AbrB family looped-hinge helix DNA binding protein
MTNDKWSERFGKFIQRQKQQRSFLWYEIWYSNGMKTTIDKAGRVIIPAAIRDRAGLKPGTTLEVLADDIGVRLIPIGPEVILERRGRRLIARPAPGSTELPEVDLAGMVEEERNRWPW